MFSSIKMEEYTESELSDIFQVKLVAKTIIRRSPVAQCRAVSAVSLFEETCECSEPDCYTLVFPC